MDTGKVFQTEIDVDIDKFLIELPDDKGASSENKLKQL